MKRLDPDGLQKVNEALPEYLRLVVEIVCCTGMRPIEVLSLTRIQVTWPKEKSAG